MQNLPDGFESKTVRFDMYRDIERLARNLREMNRSPVRFDCEGCGIPWFVPGQTGCDTCGPGTPAVVDERVWELSYFPALPFYLTGHLRDEDRFKYIVGLGVKVVIDVAGDPDGTFVWRPSSEDFDRHGMDHILIEDVADNGVAIPSHAFEASSQAALAAWGRGHIPLFHCAAGLRRSPALVYGFLRRIGLSPDVAKAVVVGTRPFVDLTTEYVTSAELWLDNRQFEFAK